MFNKEVCKKCLGDAWNDEGFSDDENWDKRGMILCILKLDEFKITDPVPFRCPYKLEHIIANGKQNEVE